MKNVLLLTIGLVFLQGALLAQRVIEVNYTDDGKGNYVFTCTNRAYCPYILHVGFTTMENLQSDHALPFEDEVKPGQQVIFKLSRLRASEATNMKYNVQTRKGCMHPGINTGFTYLLPFAPNKQAQAYVLDTTIGNRPAARDTTGNAGSAGTGSGGGAGGAGKQNTSNGPVGYYAVRFRMKPGDTVYAARRGVVTVVDVSSDRNDAGANSLEGWNSVEIVHGDCSFGEYGILKKDGAFVHPGQTVEAGTPLGLIGGDSFGRGSDARFSVYYYTGSSRAFIPLSFWTKKNGKGMLKHGAVYTSEFPAAVIGQETGKGKTGGKAVPKKGSAVKKKG